MAVEPTGSVANDNKPTKSVAPEKVLDEREGGNKLKIELHGKIKEQIRHGRRSTGAAVMIEQEQHRKKQL